MDNGQPATRAELQATKSELQTAIAATKSELQTAIAATKAELQASIVATRDDLRADIAASADRLTDGMRQIETNLLTEFHRYARGQNARIHNVEVGESDMKLRLSALEDRVLSLEIRLPPSAA